ncbi:hypothetical protein LX70_03425 [Defluviimonas denitrificans]|uniref:Uncharacterized protein n=1 Tax=Albidovulum denitrificans TaxID=404881 RepID=A0A2S8S3U4_9RHOB|nr:hypothetical protein LX70_03425 [Defluviimonas denitrificans]
MPTLRICRRFAAMKGVAKRPEQRRHSLASIRRQKMQTSASRVLKLCGSTPALPSLAPTGHRESCRLPISASSAAPTAGRWSGTSTHCWPNFLPPSALSNMNSPSSDLPPSLPRALRSRLHGKASSEPATPPPDASPPAPRAGPRNVPTDARPKRQLTRPNEPDRRTGQACDIGGLRPARSCSDNSKRQFYFAEQTTNKLGDNTGLGGGTDRPERRDPLCAAAPDCRGRSIHAGPGLLRS